MRIKIFGSWGILLFGALLMVSISCGNTGNASTAQSAAPKPSFSAVISEQQFNAFFPLRDKFYTYKAFIKAVDDLSNIKVKVIRQDGWIYQLTRTDQSTGKSTVVRQDAEFNKPWVTQKGPGEIYTIDYSAFCREKDLATNKKELAAFFANVAHETRHGQTGKYNDGLMFLHELNTNLPYTGDNVEYPPVAGKNYYGRGPLQLSYNANYGYASDCIYGDKKVLLNNPDLLTTDPVAAFKAAIYFWMSPQDSKPAAHDVMIGKWQPNTNDKAKGRTPGFGMTINIINGALECNKGETTDGMTDRIGFYQHFLTLLGVNDANCACSCGKMAPFNQ